MIRRFFHRRPPECEKRYPRIPFIGKLLMLVGLAAVLYLFITYVLMPVLAMLTVS